MLRPNWPSSRVQVVMNESSYLLKCSSRMLVTMYETTLCNISEDWNLNIYYCENQKSHRTSHTVWKDRHLQFNKVKEPILTYSHCKVTKKKNPPSCSEHNYLHICACYELGNLRFIFGRGVDYIPLTFLSWGACRGQPSKSITQM
jgi:hypothetical protein